MCLLDEMVWRMGEILGMLLQLLALVVERIGPLLDKFAVGFQM